MSTDEPQQGQAPGSVPNHFGNALAWRWVPNMPTPLKRAHLHTLLYTMRAMANASGELRFKGDHKPIRIQDIAKAAGADEKDARDRMEAAIKAGVVVVKGERRRGVRALYVIVVSPWPDWGAAVSHLEQVKKLREEGRKRREGGRKPAPWKDEEPEFGGPPPELDDPKNGGPPPELQPDSGEEVRGTAPRPSSGDRPPNGSGDRPPNNPGVIHESSHKGVEVSSQPQVVGPSEANKIIQIHGQDTPPDDCVLCIHCRDPLVPDPRRPDRTAHARCTERHTA